MKVVMVCPSYPPQQVTCGVGDYTRCLAEELARQGDDLAVAASTAYRGPIEGPVRVVPAFPRWSLDQARRLAAWPAVRRAEILHLQYTPELLGRGPGAAALSLLARLRRGGPATVVTFHTLTDRSVESRLWAILLLATARHAISANEEVTAMVRRRVPHLAGRLTEIPIGANVPVEPTAPDDVLVGRALVGAPPGTPLLVFFGLVYPGKGLETLFTALAELRRTRPAVRLAVVGDTRPENREYRAGLEALAARLGLGEAIRWAGRRSGAEVSRILRAADLYVVPFDDGVSIRRGSLMAGLVHGLPIVSTTSPIASAYLRDGDAVALVPPRDAGRLAARLGTLLDSPGEARRLADGARTLAGRFAWPAIAAANRAVYRRVRG